jgi:hypothetical protein
LGVIHRKNKTNLKQERKFLFDEGNSHPDHERAARFGSDVI